MNTKKNHSCGLTFLTPKSLPDFTSFMPRVVYSPKENMCRIAVCHANKDVYKRIYILATQSTNVCPST